MLPAIYFKFSRVQCERCAREIIANFVTHEERKEIDLIFRNRLSKYKQYYGHLQQYHDVYNQLLKGVVYHHSGLIPILKEIIEILYAKGLIKLLFATETFAVGVNMPAKAVIFNDLEKYDNNGVSFKSAKWVNTMIASKFLRYNQSVNNASLQIKTKKL